MVLKKPIIEPVYLLPNGTSWRGKVHQLEDGQWKTGSTETLTSIEVLEVSAELEYPYKNQVAREEIFNKIFTYLKNSSASYEISAAEINSSLLEYETLLGSLSSIVDSNIDKLKQFIISNHVQSENNGTGIITDSEINLKLGIESVKSFDSKIKNITFIPNTEAPIYAYTGDIETGLQTELTDAKTTQTMFEVISRTGSTLGATLDPILTIGTSYQVGVNGIFKIELEQPETLTMFKFDTNGVVESVQFGDSDPVIIWDNIEPVTVSTIKVMVSYTAPIPFSSYISEDSSEDLLGNPQEGQILLEEKVYQRTRLLINEITLSNIGYQATKEFELGPYTANVGTLKSLYLSSIESMDDTTNIEAHVKYYLIIDNKEYKIVPSNRNSEEIRLYYINSGLSSENKSTYKSTIGFIDTTTEQISWRIKVVLSRGDSAYLTPDISSIRYVYTTSINGDLNG